MPRVVACENETCVCACRITVFAVEHKPCEGKHPPEVLVIVPVTALAHALRGYLREPAEVFEHTCVQIEEVAVGATQSTPGGPIAVHVEVR